MAHQTVSQRMKAIAGAALLGLGFLLLFSNLDTVAESLTEGVVPLAPEGMDAFLTFGLATIHAVQTYAFAHAQFVSIVRQILVSFWPLILVFLGALLLRGAFEKHFLGYSAHRSSLANGERL